MMREQQLHFATHCGVVAATPFNAFAPLLVLQLGALEEDVHNKTMLLVVHGSSPASSFRSQARIIVHSASIVRLETFNT